MSDLQPAPLYGVVGQPLTQDYLAGQLPIFQQKVPSAQTTLQFPTNAPANLPLPPLYPGEVVMLQEHRIVCTDAFEEPAVGAVYISNYRIIFQGNLISDPDSMDALQDTSWKYHKKEKEQQQPADSAPSPIPFKPTGNRFNPFASSRTEPSFKSFLVGDHGQGQGTSEEESSQLPASQEYGSLPRHVGKLKSGFRKISSLRLTSHSRPKPKKSSLSHADLPDGVPRESIKEEAEAAAAPQGHKRKDIMLNYRQETVSLDSVSVSSTSEFSSAAGTDDRSTSSPPDDGGSVGSGPVDIVGGGRTCGFGFSDPLLSCSNIGDVSIEASGTSYLTVDSGITFGGSSAATSRSAESPMLSGKGSSELTFLTGKGSPSSQTHISGTAAAVNGKQVSKDATLTSKDAENQSLDKSWHSKSDTDSTLKGSASSVSMTTKAMPTSNGSNGACVDDPDASPLSGDGRDVHSPAPEEFIADNGTTLVNGGHVRGADQAGRVYANVRLPAARPDWSAGIRAEDSIKGVSRKRSKSGSSHIRKKPKPLPRKSLTKQVLMSEEERSELFMSSLPASFKPVPLPRATPPGSSGPRTPPTPKWRSVECTTFERDSLPECCDTCGDPVVDSSNTRDDSSNPVVDSSNTRGDTSNTRGDTSDPVVDSSNSRGDSSDPVVDSSNTRGDTSNTRGDTSNTRGDSSDPVVDSSNVSLPPQHSSLARAPSTSKRKTLSLPRRLPPCPPQCVSPPGCNRPLSPTATVFSTPNTPLHKEAIAEAAGMSVSEPGTPHCASSAPSSPFYASSNSNSAFSSDVEASLGRGQDEAATSEPVPPPRRKRRSKYNSKGSSKDSLLSVEVMPVSPEELLASEGHLPHCLGEVSTPAAVTEMTVSIGEGSIGSSCKSHDTGDSVSGKSHDLSDSISGKSRDAGDSIVSGKSRDLNEEEDVLSSPLEEDVFAQHNTVAPPTATLVDRCSVSSSVRTSTTSLTVLVDNISNSRLSSVTMRPYSNTRPYSFVEAFMESYEKSGEVSFSGGHTLPKSGAVSTTWSPRGQAHHSRQSLKGGVVPACTRYSLCVSFPLRSIHSVRKLASVSLKERSLKLPEGLLVLCRTFQSMRLHVHPENTYDADGLKVLLERKFLVDTPLQQRFAFHFRAAIKHPNPTFLQNRSPPNHFHLSSEMIRLGLDESKQWTVSRVLTSHPMLCLSYPSHLLIPTCTGDLDYIRGARHYQEGRFPTLTWYSRSTGAALLRAACTHDERGHSNMQVDEALLQSISGSKLDLKGPPMIVHVYTDKPESGLNERSAEQSRTYYYHNCKFKYGANLPDYRSVRHSFNKLQAMLENALSDEDYLIALDTTRWLPRLADLISTAQAIARSVVVEGAHALVCYEAGWDRTTQLVGLAQLLMDPYYRTMDGFQVLVQKEWVWFGHPFQQRHSRSGKSKEDGPIFLQWTDCVWQLMHQCPSAFEFNDKLLMSMVEHSYSGLFGTFMTNSEGTRKQFFSEKGFEHMCVSTHTVSFWTWVGVLNAVGRTFYNDLYDSKIYPGLLKPNSATACLRLWSSHYCRCKPQEHVYQSSVLQKQLEELLKSNKKLEALLADLAPISSEGPSSSSALSFLPPPPVGPRDELMTNSIGGGSHRDRPTPPPKPAARGYLYETLEEFLVKEGFDPSICMHLELGAAACQGNLYKLGAVRKNWLQRWFVLDFNCQYFAYFENQTAYSNKDTPKGVIRLSDIIRVFQDVRKRDHLMKNIFMLETPHRTYQMQAPTIMSMYIWIACLELPVSALKLGTP